MADIGSKIKLTDIAGNEINPVTEESVAGATITSSSKDISVTGTAVSIGTTEIVRSILIQAKTTNVGLIYVGISGACSTTVYMKKLSAGETWEIAIEDISNLYINGTGGEGINFFKLK